jgi:sigma-B regulation protein RsbU (phosphoserine phosphatase)
MKILVAEDDRATRLRIVAYLREWGHDPLEAADGAEAWAFFQQEDIDLLISDWQMPNVDGIELIRSVREKRAGSRFLYVILLTSRSEKKDVVKGIECGADDFITKPFDKDELRVRIRAGERILELERNLDDKNRYLEEANRVITKSNERMHEELKAAARIQQAYLPADIPDLAGARFEWRYEPCEELGGDTLNIIPFDQNRIGLYVIDVSGHGVPSALLSVHLSRILTDLDARDAYLGKRDPGGERLMLEAPARVAARLNEVFSYNLATQQYFTFLYGILDLEAGTFQYTSAGHPGPIVVSEGKATLHQATPPGVGIDPDGKFTERTLSFRSGDRIFFYTDGLFEIDNEAGVEFGEERLRGLIADSASESLSESVKTVMDTIHRWRGEQGLDDDLSLMAVGIR